jgi:uncharacterized protein
MSQKRFFMEGVLKEKEDGPVLVGNTCTRCEKVYFPKVEFCPRCYAQDLVERELSRKGTLHAFTFTRVPLERFDPPHSLGIVLLPQDKVSVMTPLLVGESEELQVGMEMELVVAPLWLQEDGSEVYGYKFAKSAGRVG